MAAGSRLTGAPAALLMENQPRLFGRIARSMVHVALLFAKYFI
jgi:hypothetical protein